MISTAGYWLLKLQKVTCMNSIFQNIHPGLYLIVLTDEFVLKVNKVVLP